MRGISHERMSGFLSLQLYISGGVSSENVRRLRGYYQFTAPCFNNQKTYVQLRKSRTVFTFAALTGYEEDITETARRTDSQLNTSEDEEKLERLNRIIAFLRENAASHPRISVTYFVPDRRKDGGKYLSEEGCFKKTDEAEMSLCLTNGKKFYISDIYDIMLI